MTNQNFSHPFTLLELMVAAAVLVIMMSFIFQFTNSAQRLWNTNTGRTEMSESMDVIFNLLNEDFENMYVVSPNQDLDAQAGWYCMHRKDGVTTKYPFANVKEYNLEDLCFFTQKRESDDASGIAMIHPVRYHFVPGTDPDNSDIGAGKLYRFEAENMTWDKIADGFEDSDKGGDPEWYISIDSYRKDDGTIDDDKLEAFCEKYEDNLIAENLQSVQIFSSAAVDAVTGETLTASKMPLMEIPQGITVTVIASVPSTLRNGENSNGDAKTTDRAMTRVYMLR